MDPLYLSFSGGNITFTKALQVVHTIVSWEGDRVSEGRAGEQLVEFNMSHVRPASTDVKCEFATEYGIIRMGRHGEVGPSDLDRDALFAIEC